VQECTEDLGHQPNLARCLSVFVFLSIVSAQFSHLLSLYPNSQTLTGALFPQRQATVPRVVQAAPLGPRGERTALPGQGGEFLRDAFFGLLLFFNFFFFQSCSSYITSSIAITLCFLSSLLFLLGTEKRAHIPYPHPLGAPPREHRRHQRPREGG
jgi:hypothetical protein